MSGTGEQGVTCSVAAPGDVPYVAEPVDFDAFYRREYRPVLAFALAIVRNQAAAEDVTQEAFASVYRQWKRGGDVHNPSGYVRTVVANRCRSGFRRRLVEARALLALGSRRPPITSMPEQSDRFWDAVRGLPARQAQVVALHYLEDRSVEDIAGLLGIAEGTVKVHLHRARTALAAELGLVDDSEEEPWRPR